MLVVEDIPDELELYTVILQHAGAEVLPAASARAALELLEQARPDVLVSDLRLPDQDGLALLGSVRALARQQRGQVPALALTGYGYFHPERQVLAAGFDAYCLKPCGVDDLVALVGRLAGR